MYNYLFYFFYSYYDRTEKWKEAKIPFLSTVLILSVLLMFNFLFIRDLLTYHLNGFKYESFKYENLLVPSIFIGLNYWYFKSNDRYKSTLKNYNQARNKNQTKFYLSWGYIILSVAFLILMGYSIRNNIRWI